MFYCLEDFNKFIVLLEMQNIFKCFTRVLDANVISAILLSLNLYTFGHNAVSIQFSAALPVFRASIRAASGHIIKHSSAPHGNTCFPPDCGSVHCIVDLIYLDYYLCYFLSYLVIRLNILF